MNVLYDIARLGIGYENSGYKTGIFRVAESLAEQLVLIPECKLQFCATDHGAGARAYWRTNPNLCEVPFAAASAKYSLRSLRNRGAGAATRRPSSVAVRAAHAMLSVLDDTVGLGARPVEASALAWAEIYHSIYLPLPQQIKRAKHIKRFLTVYDLTPILLPQYFDPKSSNFDFASYLANILQTVGSEDTALCISQATKNDFCSYSGHDPALAPVVYLAADPCLFYPCNVLEKNTQIRAKYAVPEGPYVLSLSTLAPHKNIEHVIKCFARLATQENIGDLSLVLAGSKGWNYNSIFEELDVAQNIKNKIIVTGRVEDNDLAVLYSGALVFTYMSHYEGFGLPPLEAMQCGVPVITSNTSSLPEVVGDAGIMLDPTDADGWCQSILQLYQHESVRKEMAQKSLERSKLFSWERCARETVTAYETALSGCV